MKHWTDPFPLFSGKLKKGETLYKVLRESGLRNSQIANGRQIAIAYENWVITGHMTEDFFDKTMNYLLSVSLNKITREAPNLARAYLNQPEEWDCLAKHKTTRAHHQIRLDSEARNKAEVKSRLEAIRIRQEVERKAPNI